jgi:hypothetical protein
MKGIHFVRNKIGVAYVEKNRYCHSGKDGQKGEDAPERDDDITSPLERQQCSGKGPSRAVWERLI